MDKFSIFRDLMFLSLFIAIFFTSIGYLMVFNNKPTRKIIAGIFNPIFERLVESELRTKYRHEKFVSRLGKSILGIGILFWIVAFILATKIS